MAAKLLMGFVPDQRERHLGPSRSNAHSQVMQVMQVIFAPVPPERAEAPVGRGAYDARIASFIFLSSAAADAPLPAP